jgi:hypothetical protein
MAGRQAASPLLSQPPLQALILSPVPPPLPGPARASVSRNAHRSLICAAKNGPAGSFPTPKPPPVADSDSPSATSLSAACLLLIFPSCFLSLGTARWQLSSAQHSFRLRFRIADLLLGMILTLSSMLLLAFLSLQIAPTLWWLTLAIPHPQDRPLSPLSLGRLPGSTKGMEPMLSSSPQTDVSISSDGLTALVVDFATVCQIDLSTATATSPVQPIVQRHIS